MIKTLEIDPDIFNEIYFELENAFHDPKTRYIFAYGGSSAGKSFSFAQLAVKELMSKKDNNFLILRKFAVDIKDSIFADFKKIIEDWGLNDLFIIQINYIKCVQTGSYIRFRGLDDSEKVKGISNFQRIVLEEISQFDFEDFKQIRKRLRGRKGQQIIGLFNPIEETHWIKTKVFDVEILQERESKITQKWVNDIGNMQIFKVTYLDNKYIVGPNFIDEHVIADFEHDRIHDSNYYNVYGLGNWGKLRTGGEFWKDFKPEIHVGPVEWNKDLALHISWDDNVNPYLPMGVFQIDGNKAYQIDEFCLSDPLNKVRHVCKRFKEKYPVYDVPKLFIYGDRTSIKENTTKEKGHNFFTEIENELAEYNPVRRIGSSNPSVLKSGEFINKVWAFNYGGIELKIGNNCKTSIFDYTYALEAADGTIDKKTIQHPVTKVRYQEFGHCFVGETMIETINGPISIDRIKAGDLVLTRKGYKKVLNVFDNGIRDVKEYNVGPNKLVCTPDHKVFVNKKFVPISLINKGIFCIFDSKTKEICYQKQLVTMGINSQDTQNQKKEQKGFIILDGLVNKRKDYIGIFMNVLMDLLKKAYTYTILMVTHLIMIFQIWKKFLLKNIVKPTTNQEAMSTKQNSEKDLLSLLYQNQKNGIGQKKEKISIRNILGKICFLMFHRLKIVLTAVLNFHTRLKTRNTVQKNVIINTKQEGLEQKRQVYDIEVEGEHEYFANGVLVHNCSDLLRYFMVYAFPNEYGKILMGERNPQPVIAKNRIPDKRQSY